MARAVSRGATFSSRWDGVCTTAALIRRLVALLAIVEARRRLHSSERCVTAIWCLVDPEQSPRQKQSAAEPHSSSKLAFQSQR